jgi:hypothetical protein
MVGTTRELTRIIGECLARAGDVVIVDLERARIVRFEVRARIDRLLRRLVMVMSVGRRRGATGAGAER